MFIRAGFRIAFECSLPVPGVITLNVHPERRCDLVTADTLVFDRPAHPSRYTDAFGNICIRFVFSPGITTISSNFIVRDSGLPDPVVPEAHLTPVENLPADVLVFLLGSRYCETDRMSDLAWKLFADTPPTWARVQAIVDYVHDTIEFGYQHARATRTSWEAHEERKGVCRDYAHLAITLCRCMNIPARYCTGYLGDIGIPPVDAPMDFSAWFEVFLDGQWHTFDARHNTPRIGRILIARGRDATDTAISTTFGQVSLKAFKVVADELADAKSVSAA